MAKSMGSALGPSGFKQPLTSCMTLCLGFPSVTGRDKSTHPNSCCEG